VTVCSSFFRYAAVSGREDSSGSFNVTIESEADEPESLWLLSCKVAAAVIFRVLLLLCACLTALSRSDVVSYGLVICSMYVLADHRFLVAEA
jgi:hypothetical protein